MDRVAVDKREKKIGALIFATRMLFAMQLKRHDLNAVHNPAFYWWKQRLLLLLRVACYRSWYFLHIRHSRV